MEVVSDGQLIAILGQILQSREVAEVSQTMNREVTHPLLKVKQRNTELLPYTRHCTMYFWKVSNDPTLLYKNMCRVVPNLKMLLSNNMKVHK